MCLIKNILRRIRNKLSQYVWYVRREYTGHSKSIIDGYFSRHQVKGLHVGCGGNLLDGWLNSELSPRTEDILQLNAIKPFPVKGCVFDYVFSEHMIEHVPYCDGVSMLKECYRILKKMGGCGYLRLT